MNEPRHRETLIHLTHEESNFYFSFCVTQRERQSEREREREGNFSEWPADPAQDLLWLVSHWANKRLPLQFHSWKISMEGEWAGGGKERWLRVWVCVCACGCMCVCVCVGDWVVVPLCLARQTESSLPYFITIVKWTKESCIVFLWKVVNV